MIVPLLHRVLIKADKVETKTEAGIILALDEKRENAAAETGRVISIGPTCFKDYGGNPEDIKIGDKIAFAKYAGKTIKDKEEEYVLLNDEDIIAIIKE